VISMLLLQCEWGEMRLERKAPMRKSPSAVHVSPLLPSTQLRASTQSPAAQARGFRVAVSTMVPGNATGITVPCSTRRAMHLTSPPPSPQSVRPVVLRPALLQPCTCAHRLLLWAASCGGARAPTTIDDCLTSSTTMTLMTARPLPVIAPSEHALPS